MGIKTSFLILFMATCWGTSLTFRQTHVFSKDVIILLRKAVGQSIFEPSNSKVLSILGKEQSNFRPMRDPKSTGLMVWKAALTKTCNAPYQGCPVQLHSFQTLAVGAIRLRVELESWAYNPQKVASSLDQIVWDCLRQAWPETQMKIKRKYWIFF